MNDILNQLIAKKLSGEATKEDENIIASWMGESPDNVLTYERIEKAWNTTGIDNATPNFDTTAAWEKVSAEIKTPVKKSKTIALSQYFKYSIGIAAMIWFAFFINRAVMDKDMMIVSAKDANKEIVLPDNSHVSLRKGSELKYPKKFNEHQRNIELDGEAFFDVTRNENAPFTISTKSVSVTVLGTSFNVNSGSNKATVVVKTGKVKVSSSDNETNTIILRPDERGILENGMFTKDTVVASNYLYWKTGKINFDNVPLLNAVTTIGELTDTVITLDDDLSIEQRNQLVTISFGNQSVEDMIKELTAITEMNWEKVDNTYRIKNK